VRHPHIEKPAEFPRPAARRPYRVCAQRGGLRLHAKAFIVRTADRQPGGRTTNRLRRSESLAGASRPARLHQPEVIAHPAPASASPGRLVDSTNRTVSSTEAPFALAVLTTER